MNEMIWQTKDHQQQKNVSISEKGHAYSFLRCWLTIYQPSSWENAGHLHICAQTHGVNRCITYPCQAIPHAPTQLAVLRMRGHVCQPRWGVGVADEQAFLGLHDLRKGSPVLRVDLFHHFTISRSQHFASSAADNPRLGNGEKTHESSNHPKQTQNERNAMDTMGLIWSNTYGPWYFASFCIPIGASCRLPRAIRRNAVMFFWENDLLDPAWGVLWWMALSESIQIAKTYHATVLETLQRGNGCASIHSSQKKPDKALPSHDSLDWFKGQSTGNHGFYHQI